MGALKDKDWGKKLESLQSSLYNSRQHIAGSPGERAEAERISSVAEKALSHKAELISVPTLTWSPEWVEVEPKPGFSVMLPYTLEADVEGPVSYVEGDPSNPLSWRRFPGGRIAIIPEPNNPDDIEPAALLASEAGAEALLVESRVPRIIVTKGSWGYSASSGSPTPIPVVAVPQGYRSLAEREGRVSVKTSAKLSESHAYIVSVDLGGREPQVLVGAHYDRWFTGFQDNILGVAQAILATLALSEHGFSTRLLVFSAEEQGAPGPASWYWAWASRFYAKQLVSSRLECSFAVYINFDLAGMSGLKISGSPQYVASSVLQERCCECPECDSFQLAKAGIPTISLHSLWSKGVTEIYHTPLDTPEAHSPRHALLAVEEAVRLASQGPKWEGFSARLREWLGQGPLLARRAYYLLEAIARRAGWKDLYCEAAKEFLNPVHYGSYRADEAGLEALWFPEVTVYKRIIKDVRQGKAPREVWISGEEKLLYAPADVKGKPLSPRRLADQARGRLKEFNEKIEEIQRKVIA